MTPLLRLVLPAILALIVVACSAPERASQSPTFSADPAGKLRYRATEKVEEPISFLSSDSAKFAFHIKHETETGNDVFYWGWNPPFVNYNPTEHSAAFSLERNYEDNIEWNLDVRGSFGPTEKKYQSRPIHAMINAKSGFPKTLDFAFGRVTLYSMQNQMNERIMNEYAMFSMRENRFAGPLEVGSRLNVRGPLTLNNEFHKVPPGETTLYVNWSTANLHTYELRREDRCEVFFTRTEIGQTVRLILQTDRAVSIDWKSGTLFWRNSKPVTRIGGKQGITVFKITRIKLNGIAEAYLIEEEGAYGAE